MRRKTRLLLIGYNYFLERELFNASKFTGIELKVFPAHKYGEGYFPALMESVLEYKPDAVLSINAMGIDSEWKLLGLLERIGARLCIWFIDSPEHFIAAPAPESENLLLFSIEKQSLPLLQNWGYKRVHYLPLAADAARFQFERDRFVTEPEITASFIGHTWTLKKAMCLKNRHFPRGILRRYKELGARFAEAPEPSVAAFLQREEPEFFTSAMLSLGNEGLRDLCILICWEANFVRRVPMVRELLPFKSIIAGDPYWKMHLGENEGVLLHPFIGYYTAGLYDLYRNTKVNLNISSAQLPTSTTQRAFDVPAAGGFLLSDFRDQITECFTPGEEVVTFTDVHEIRGLVEYYAANRVAAGTIVANARKRILSDHTYSHRLGVIVSAVSE